MRSILVLACIHVLMAAVACQPLREAKQELELSRRANRQPLRSPNVAKPAHTVAKRRVEGLAHASEAISEIFSRVGRRLRGEKTVAAEAAEATKAKFESARPKLFPQHGAAPDQPQEQPFTPRTRRPFRFTGTEAGYSGDVNHDLLRAQVYEQPPLYSSPGPDATKFGGALQHDTAPRVNNDRQVYGHFWQDPKQRPRMAVAAAVSAGATLLIAQKAHRDQEAIQNLNAEMAKSQAQQQTEAQQAISQNEALAESGSQQAPLKSRQDSKFSVDSEQPSTVRLKKRFQPFTAVRGLIQRTSFMRGAHDLRFVVQSLPDEAKKMVVKCVVGATALGSVAGILLYFGFRDDGKKKPTPAPAPTRYAESSDAARRLHKRSLVSIKDDSHVEATMLGPKWLVFGPQEDHLTLETGKSETVRPPRKGADGSPIAIPGGVRPPTGGQVIKDDRDRSSWKPMLSKQSTTAHEPILKRMFFPAAHMGNLDANPPEDEPRATARIHPVDIQLPAEAEEIARTLDPRVVTGIGLASSAAVLGGFIGLGLYLTKKDDEHASKEPDNHLNTSVYKLLEKHTRSTYESPFTIGREREGKQLSKRSLKEMVEMAKMAREDFHSLSRQTALSPAEKSARAERLRKYVVVGGSFAALEAAKGYVVYKVIDSRARKDERKRIQEERQRQLDKTQPASQLEYSNSFLKRDHIPSAQHGDSAVGAPPAATASRLYKRAIVNPVTEIELEGAHEAAVDPRWQAWTQNAAEVSKDVCTYFVALMAGIGGVSGLTWLIMRPHSPEGGPKSTRPLLHETAPPLHKRALVTPASETVMEATLERPLPRARWQEWKMKLAQGGKMAAAYAAAAAVSAGIGWGVTRTAMREKDEPQPSKAHSEGSHGHRSLVGKREFNALPRTM